MADQKDGKTSISAAQIAFWGTVIAAVLGLIGVLISAALNFPPVIKHFEGTPTPSSTPTLTSESPVVPDLSATTASIDLTATSVPPAGFFALTSTPEFPSVMMSVKLQPNRVGGTPPLNIQINARQSFVKSPDGSIMTCTQSTCSFVWSIYQGDQIIYGPREWEGTFSYTFKSAGMYFIKVKVCRGTVCGNGGIQIVAAQK